MRAYDFKDTVKIGNKGFNEVESILKTLPYHYVALDRQLNKEYMKKDIDFIWIYENKGIQKKTCELKNDTQGHKTRNLFIELVTCMELNNKGNYYYTECELFMYYFIHSKELLIIPMDLLRKYIESNMNRFKVAYSKSKLSNTKTKTAKGILVPIVDLMTVLKGKYKYITGTDG